MTQAQPSKVKVWAQTQFGRVVLKVYQAKMAWNKRFGKNASADDAPAP
jgi:hypothetical protein